MKKNYFNLATGTIVMTFLASLLLTSYDNAATIDTSEIRDSNAPQNLNQCNTAVFEVYPEAATIWSKSWEALHSSEVDKGVRVLVASDLSNLFDQMADTAKAGYGLRFYYALRYDSIDIPDLVITYTKNCSDIVGKDNTVLLLTADGATHRIHKDTAAVYTKNWQSKPTNDAKTNVTAYNYNLAQIDELFDTESSDEIKVYYGIRTLSPREYETEFGGLGSGDQTDMFGSAVYVNILYTGDNVAQILMDDNGYLDDFSRPCPRFCDPDTTNLMLPTF